MIITIHKLLEKNMSTRANIIVKDSLGQLIFYRHSDGYPEGAMPLLNDFLNLLKDGKIRDSVTESAGWLIILGHNEYAEMRRDYGYTRYMVGSIEPTTEIHGDIRYLYEIDVEKKTIECWKYDEEKGDKVSIDEFIKPTVVSEWDRKKGENDEDFKNRLIKLIPEGGVHQAEDIGNASGDELDVLAKMLKNIAESVKFALEKVLNRHK